MDGQHILRYLHPPEKSGRQKVQDYDRKKQYDYGYAGQCFLPPLFRLSFPTEFLPDFCEETFLFLCEAV